ncbi:MAG TPA: glycoside hydrolase family 15 protein [Thermomicrobiales bacterium]|nr:glycoside hydrolase family 15 protein [Thermomicrobiales bacterium]
MPTTILPDIERNQGFRPVTYLDGYLPIEDYGLIGNGTTAALVGLDGSIPWLCIPRFDSVPIFSSILDSKIGGQFRIEAGAIHGARHRYLGDSSVLITELKLETGILRITDLMPFKSGADLASEGNLATGELLRCVEVVEGEVKVQARITVRGGVEAERHVNGVRLRMPRYPDLDLVLEASRELRGADGAWNLRQGESVNFCLRWNGGTGASSVDAPVAAIVNTVEGWLAWLRRFNYHGPQRRLVRRSAITLKLLAYLPNGALVAAPTCSLPEEIGGERNWDYRYTWVRDASFAVYALRRIGLEREAWQFLNWVLGRFRDQRVNVMYTLDGNPIIKEREDDELSGYRNSRPVRWGNEAHAQVQHDIYGEILDCAFQWSNHGGIIREDLWKQLEGLVELAAKVWDTPDDGIWEVRSPGFVQTYSAGICQVALNRGARLARRYGFAANVDRWDRIASDIQQAILTQGWNEEKGYITRGLHGGHLDASVLALPIRRVIPADHPRMVHTVEAIQRELSATDDMLYRYLQRESADGLSGGEGAFLLCSFWMVDNLTLQGRLGEAMERYDRLCARTNDLGLLPEEIDPGSGRFLGNFPQAFSHIGLISSGVNLAHALQSVDRGKRKAGIPQRR